MEDLKVGMYVIQKDRLKIGQIIGFCECDRCKERGFYEPIITNNIYITNYDKANNFDDYNFSNNIIDLLIPGDYVNSKEITWIISQDICGDEVLDHQHIFFDYKEEIHKEDIKTIVTKEQFASMEYKVGEK